MQEEFEEFEGGTFAGVIDIFFVGHAEDADAAVADGFADIIQKVGDSADDISGHERVDFAGQFDEAGAHAIASGEPAEVEGVDGDTVSTEAWSGVEGLEAEGFGFCGIDNFPDIDAHAVEQHFEFVDEGDVDGAIGVFEDLAGFGDFGVVNADDFDDGVTVEVCGEVTGMLIGAANDLWDPRRGVVGVAWVFAFGAEGCEVIATAAESGGIVVEDGDEYVAGGGGVGGTFKDDKLSGAQDASDGVPGGFNELEVRVAGFVEGCGDTDEECVGFMEPIHVAGGIEHLSLNPVGDGGGGDVSDVAGAAPELLDFGVIDVIANAFETGVGEGADEGKSDVAKTDDADAGGAIIDFEGQFGGEIFGRLCGSSNFRGVHGIFRETGEDFRADIRRFGVERLIDNSLRRCGIV